MRNSLSDVRPGSKELSPVFSMTEFPPIADCTVDETDIRESIF